MALAASASGCGLTSRNNDDDQPAKPRVEELRFSKIATGINRYCGLTLEKDVVCVKGGQLDLRWEGPFQDMAHHQDLEVFSELCASTEAGALECELTEDQVPVGERFTKVAIGFFNPCALTDQGKVVCWFDASIGGSPAPEIAGAIDLSVDMYRGCVRRDQAGHTECFGKATPNGAMDDHFLHVAVASNRICGMTLGPDAPGLDCIDESGQKTRLTDGFFSSVDVEVGGSGCAVAEGSMFCWDDLAGKELGGSFAQVSVAPGRVCALDFEGAVTCSD
jgi:hypothetical protein